jgi:hypothetical protein
VPAHVLLHEILEQPQLLGHDVDLVHRTIHVIHPDVRHEYTNGLERTRQ